MYFCDGLLMALFKRIKIFGQFINKTFLAQGIFFLIPLIKFINVRFKDKRYLLIFGTQSIFKHIFSRSTKIRINIKT